MTLRKFFGPFVVGFLPASLHAKFLIIVLILSSFIAYLEWGGDQRTFLITAEIEIIRKFFHSPSDVIHPFVLIPLAGQLLLLIALFQKYPSRGLVYTGMAMISVLLLFIFFIGIMSGNLKILMSVVPFLVTGFVVLRFLRRR